MSRYKGLIGEKLYNRINASKRVSRLNVTKDDVLNGIATFDAINDLGEDEVIFQNMNLEDYKIPVQFKDFVTPKAVRLVPEDKRFADILVRDHVSDKILNYDEELNVLTSICSAYKVNSPQMVSISELRKAVSVGDAVRYAEVEGCGVYWDGVMGRLPYLITNCGLAKKVFYNAEAADVIDQWIRDFPNLFAAH